MSTSTCSRNSSHNHLLNDSNERFPAFANTPSLLKEVEVIKTLLQLGKKLKWTGILFDSF